MLANPGGTKMPQDQAVPAEGAGSSDSKRLAEAAMAAAKVGGFLLPLLPGGKRLFTAEVLGFWGLAEGEADLGIGSFLARIHPEDRELVKAARQRAEKVGDPFSLDFRVTPPGGGVRWLRCHGATERDAAGHPSFIVGTLQDVTDRKIALLALERVRRELERAQEIGRLGSWSRSLESEEFLCSEQVYRIGGVDPASFVPTPQRILEMVHPDDRPRVAAAQLSVEQLRDVEFRIVRPGGEVRWVSLNIVVERNEAGKPVRKVGSFQDITERRLMQDRLQVAERMASLGTIAGGLAHEINNPLSYAISNVTWVGDRIERVAAGLATKEEATELRSALEDAADGLERIRAVVKDLKVFARPDEEPRPVDVHRVIESSLAVASNELRHRARIVRRFGRVPPVRAVEARLGHVFLNLLVTAARAIPEGAADRHEVSVATRVDAEGRVIVEVGDTGKGIAPELLPRIFEPFFAARPGGELPGVGLSVCKAIVESLGGEIRVESHEGGGTVFRVALPTAPGGAATGPEGKGPERCSVLVVDDEALVARSVTRLLEDDYDVVEISDSREALRRIGAGERFDMILCDLMMPDLSGPEFFEEVGRIDRRLAERMVFITGGAFTSRAREFLETSGRPWIEKPFAGDGLRGLVRAQLEAAAGMLSP
jgi:signal transduction histidine kinase/CheY-like chemotaxis protein